MADKEVKRWVAEQLHTLLGYSDKIVADFIVTTARKHTHSGSLATALLQQGLQAGPRTQLFAEELLARLPKAERQSAAAAAAAEETRSVLVTAVWSRRWTHPHASARRKTRELLKKNRNASLLEPLNEPVPAPPAPPTLAAKEVKERRKFRDKSKSTAQDAQEEDAGPQLPVPKSKRVWEEDDEERETAEARAERLAEAARLKDQQV
jgi:pre-mRNA-splicing factor ATP-dependent RNA helicase DHX16